MGGAGNDMEALRARAGAYLEQTGRGENMFRPGADQAVFIAVDMQNFVCDPEPGRALPGIGRVMAKVNRMADFCHERGIPVVWLRQCFSRNGAWDDVGLYGTFHKQPLDPGMFDDGLACQLSPEVHFDPRRDFTVEKTCYSAFAPGSSRLETLLVGMNRSHLIMAGAATNVCVESTARDAMQRGYEVTVLSDATTAFDGLVHEISLLNIRLFFGDVRPLAGLLQVMNDG